VGIEGDTVVAKKNKLNFKKKNDNLQVRAIKRDRFVIKYRVIWYQKMRVLNAVGMR
jgi:hypothetical protein